MKMRPKALNGQWQLKISIFLVEFTGSSQNIIILQKACMDCQHFVYFSPLEWVDKPTFLFYSSDGINDE
jgi:hypothetical protein